MKIAIIGVGWIGLPLAHRLQGRHTIVGTTRTLGKKSESFELRALNFPEIPQDDLLDQDVVVLNIPPFEQQLQWFQQWNWKKVKHLIFISSTSVYGAQQLQVNEQTAPEPDSDSGKLLLKEEDWFLQNTPSTIVRFGGLFGGERHPGKFLSGRKDLKGALHPVNMLEREDALNFIELIINQKPKHTHFNLIHPDHPTRQEFYQGYCQRAGIPLPEFALDLSAGKQVNSLWTPDIFQFRHKRVTG